MLINGSIKCITQAQHKRCYDKVTTDEPHRKINRTSRSFCRCRCLIIIIITIIIIQFIKRLGLRFRGAGSRSVVGVKPIITRGVQKVLQLGMIM